MFRKETVFEGYFAACWETSYLTEDPEYTGRSWAAKHMSKWFHEYLEHLLQEPEEEVYSIYFEDLIPKQVYERLVENLKTKFRFKIIVEAEEI